MRNELEQIEKIEDYLQGKLDANEKLEFENKIQNDPSLRMEVDAQKEIIKNVERISLKERAQNAYAKYKLRRSIRNWSLNGIIVLVVLFGAAYMVNQHASDQKISVLKVNVNGNSRSYTVDPAPRSAENNKKVKKEFGRENSDKKYLSISDNTNFFNPNRLEKQSFYINNKRDTVLKSKSGMLIKIPKNTFSFNGSDKLVKIELIEALKKSDMVLGGLTTISDSATLESGGMFRLNAKVDDQPAEIAGNRSIQTYIPSNKLNKNMKLYSGEQSNPSNRSTRLNWRDPRPLYFIEPKVLVNVENRHVKDTFGYFQPARNRYDEPKPSKRKRPVSASAIYTQKQDSDFCYSCNITRLDPEGTWSNCDCPWIPAAGEEIDFVTEVSNQTEFKCISVCIVMSKNNVSFNARQRNDKTFSFSANDAVKQRMPVGEEATLIANSYKGGKYYFAIKKFRIADKDKVSLKLIPSSEKEIKEILEKIL